MKILSKIVAVIVTLAIFLCFDAIMNFVTKDVSDFWKVSTYIGRFSIGWFFCEDIFKNIHNKIWK